MAETKGESLLAILDELTALIEGARSMPMSASILVNKAEVLDLLDAARAVVPEQVAEADAIVAGAKEVVQRGEAQAARVLERAELRARQLVEQEAVVAAAKARAAEIVSHAEAQAQALMEESNDYCDRQLAQFETELEQIAKQVKAGRTVIQARITGEGQ